MADWTRRTPVEEYLDEISTTLPMETYGYLGEAIFDTVCEFEDEIDELKAENAKLRELVCDWFGFAVGGADSLSDWNAIEAELEQRMRELGIRGF